MLVAAAAVAAGLIGFDTYQVAALGNRIKDAENTLESLMAITHQHKLDLDMLVDSLNKIGEVIIPQIYKDIDNVTQSINCQTDVKIAALELEMRILDIRKQVSNIFHALETSSVDSNLISQSTLQTMLLSDAFRGSLYQTDPQLFYHLSRSIMLDVHHDPFTISFIMATPTLLREHIGTMVHVYSVPVIGPLPI